MSQKTIAAIATPAGDGALGVIRISGEDAIVIADKVFFPFSVSSLSELEGYKAAYGEIKDGETVLDDAVALVFKTPHSFTGENTVEISVHGGSIMLRSVLRLIFKMGAFPAEAGEFTKRAFLNGKTDLTKAESIMGLISAQSEAELKLSRAAHQGKISRKIAELEANLIAADAAISVYSDYPDEDIDGLNNVNFTEMLKNGKNELSKILSDYDAGRVIREGIDTAIVGKPNVGKSTLMNMLSGSERSIVTEIAGTTRDIIEETVTVGDIILRLSDTAGIHNTEDTVESIGVERAKEKFKQAQLVLAVFDSTSPLTEDDFYLLNSLSKENTIIIINKTDLAPLTEYDAFNGFYKVETSAKNNVGYEELKEKIAEITKASSLTPESTVLINERQRACAERAFDGISEALNALEAGLTIDAVGICLDDALAALLELSGKRITTEVADEIFRRFCVGK